MTKQISKYKAAETHNRITVESLAIFLGLMNSIHKAIIHFDNCFSYDAPKLWRLVTGISNFSFSFMF